MTKPRRSVSDKAKTKYQRPRQDSPGNGPEKSPRAADRPAFSIRADSATPKESIALKSNVDASRPVCASTSPREYGFGGASELAARWEGGEIVVRSASGQVKEHRLEIDKLFHKVVMIRDRLRVLEQKINANKKLTDLEKVELQQYVTRCYGSLTSLNFLFGNDHDKFSGARG